MKIAICTPVYGDTRADFTLSLAHLLIKEARNHEFWPHMASGSILPKLRNDIAGQALAWSPDYLLWLDADHAFPPTALSELIARDVDVVGCNYPNRGNGVSSASNGGRPILPSQGLEPVDVIGLGVCLMRASVFEHITRPWFAFTEFGGEDAFFFQKLRYAADICPHVDHDLSARVAHLTVKPLTLGRANAADSILPAAGAEQR